MPITLRVVGIFYSTTVDLADVTPQRILDEAEKSPGPLATKFTYTDSEGSDGFLSVTGFSATYPNIVKSPVSDRTYPAGEFSLNEDMNACPAYTVWQYYTADSEGRPLSFGDGIKSFANTDVKVPANGFLTWRLVSILRGPNPMAKAMARRV